MKKRSLIAFFVMVSVSIQAQKLTEGSLNFLKGEKQLYIAEFDFSSAIIHKKEKSADFFERQHAKDSDWENKFKTGIRSKFMDGLNTGLKVGLNAGNFDDATYKATVIVTDIDLNNNINAEIVFTKMNSTVVLARIALPGTAGRFGSMANLVGDASKDAGNKLGKFISKKLK